MPWRKTDVESERRDFIKLYGTGLYSVSELCQLKGISRKTAYKWIQRHFEEGLSGLKDHSRRPHHSPDQTEESQAQRIVEMRRRFGWGSPKIVSRLRELEPEVDWPAASTAGEILKREGLIKKRERAGRPPRTRPIPSVATEQPNDEWTADFKGEFRMGDRKLCYPLTVADRYSRYLLECRALVGTRFYEAWPVFLRLFHEHGLPKAIRSDSGVPFGSRGLWGLSELGVRLLRLGIEPRLGRPGHPEDNASHERMHRTLKAATTRPPGKDRAAQQRMFNRFRAEYNQERPHEGIGQKRPVTLYRNSSRLCPRELPEPVYPGHWEVLRVSKGGTMKWNGRPVFLSKPLEQQLIGLEPLDEDLWAIWFCNLELARFEERKRKLYAANCGKLRG